jgi:hypothetical protein
MGLGTIPTPSDRRVFIGTTDPPSTLIGGLQTAQMRSASSKTEEQFENTYPSYTAVGPNTWSVQLGGKYLENDDGQDIINAANETKDVVYCSMAPNGADGKTLPGTVSSLQLDISNANTITGWSATIEQAAAPTTFGGGL